MTATIRLGPFGSTQHLLPRLTMPTIATRCRASTLRSYATSDRLPKIANTSVWTAMIPTFMRKGRTRKAGERKEWNPATFYIVMFTLIGSQAIRMLTLKNNYAAYSRSTDAKIALLREVIERVRDGEKVDVEKLLGTGDEAKEREWEEVLQEIEREDRLWQQKHKKTAEPTREVSKEEKQPTQKSEGKDSVVPSTASADEDTMTKTQSTRKLNFF